MSTALKFTIQWSSALALWLLGSLSASAQVIYGSANSNTSTTVVNYSQLMSTAGPTATELNTEEYVSATGTLSGLRLEVATAPDNGAGVDSYQWTLRLNTGAGANNTDLTCTISDAETTCTDLVNTVSVTAGDLINVSLTPSNTPALTIMSWSLIFTGTAAGDTLLLATNGATTDNSATTYHVITGSISAGNAVGTDAQQIMPLAGTLKNLYVKLSAAPGTAGSGRAFDMTVLINGSTSGITCEIFETATTCTDLVNTASVSPGDLVDMTRVRTGNPAASGSRYGLTLTATTAGEFPILASLDGGTESATLVTYRFSMNSGNSGASTTETLKDEMTDAPTISAIYVKLPVGSPDNGAGTQSFAWVLRQDLGPTDATCTISETDTTCNLTGLAVGLTAGSRIANEATPSGTPTVRASAVGFVGSMAARRIWMLAE